MTQPAFSRRIRALEEWLGTPLFDRAAQPIRLTATGEWFTQNAKDLLAHAERLPSQAQAIASSSEGALRFCATHALSLTFLPQWLRGLESHLPSSRFEVVSDVLDECEAAMRQGRTQFLLCHTFQSAEGSAQDDAVVQPSNAPLDAASFQSISVGQDALLCVSAADEAGRPLLDFSDDHKTPFLTYSDASGLGRIVKAQCHRELAQSRVVLTAHLATMLKSMTLDGRGIAYLPRSLIKDDLTQGRLVQLDGRTTVHLDVRLYRSKETLAPAAEALWRAASMPDLHVSPIGG